MSVKDYKHEGLNEYQSYAKSMPLPFKDVEVVILCNFTEYGIEPGQEYNHEIHTGLKSVQEEYNRTSGKVPFKFFDFRAWKKQGVLWLDFSTRNRNNILHFLRLLSLRKKNIIFVFVGDNDDMKCLPNMLSDGSDDTNHFFWYKSFNGSNLMIHVNQVRKFLGLNKIDWSPA